MPIAPPTGPASDPGRALTNQEIARATGVIMIAFMLSGAFGLVRNMVVAAAFGAGLELDAFNAAMRVPETLFTLVAGGALGSAFIPVFSGFLNRDEFDKAWQLASGVMSLVLVASTVGAGLVFLLAEPIVGQVLVPGASPTSQALTVELMRIMLGTVIFFGFSGLLMGILNAHQQFLAPALAPTMYNVGIILGALLLSESMGVHGLAWGALLGAGLHMGVQLPALRKLPYIRLRPLFNLRTEGVLDVLRLMGPRLLGLMVVQVNFWVNVILASEMGSGSLTALVFAFTLMFTVLGILGQSLGTAVFPTLAALHAQGDTAAFRQTLSTTLRNVLFLSIPAGLGMVVMAQPIVALLFERGQWPSVDTTATAWALIFYGIGLTGHAALEILARTYYALHDTWTPVVIGGAAMVLNVILSLLFVEVFRMLGADSYPRGPFAGLALANSLATALESVVLWGILKRRIPEMDPRPVVRTLTHTAAAGAVMVGLVWAWLQVETPLLVEFSGGIVLGVVSFGGVALLLKIPEAQVVPVQIMARLRR